MKGHSGDPGNTVADVAADAGCDLDSMEFVRTSTPIKVYGIDDDEELSPNGWSGSVEKQGRRFQGRHAAVRLYKSVAKSTRSILQQGAGRELTGEIISNRKTNGLKPAAARDFIQMIGNAFPVNQIVSRNTHKSVTDKCHLCRKAVKTYPHMQMGCIKTKDVRTRIHNMILEELLKAIKTKCPTAEIDRNPKICDYCLCVDALLASFEPEAIVRWLD